MYSYKAQETKGKGLGLDWEERNRWLRATHTWLLDVSCHTLISGGGGEGQEVVGNASQPAVGQVQKGRGGVGMKQVGRGGRG